MVLRLADSNNTVMDKVYYYLRLKANIWNMLDDKSYGEESLSKDHTNYSENICFFISNLWIEREKRTNTDCTVTGWMLCIIYHIREDVFNNSNENNRNKVNTVIKKPFYCSSKEELLEIIDTF